MKKGTIMGRKRHDKSEIRDMKTAMYGAEPKWSPIPENIEEVLEKSYHYYDAVGDGRMRRKWICAYATKQKFEDRTFRALKHLSPNFYTRQRFFATARLLNLGAPVSESDRTDFGNRLSDLVKTALSHYDPQAKSSTKRTNISDMILNRHLEEVEGIMDLIMIPKKKKERHQWDIQEWMSSRKIKPKHAKVVFYYIKENFLADPLGAYNKSDEQLVESYSDWSPTQLKGLVLDLKSLLDNIKTYILASRKPRKSRRSKPINAEKIVQKVQYKDHDPSTGFASIDPSAILKSSQVILWDASYRYIRVLKAKAGATLSVRGTTVKDFDEKTSYRKKIRKPKEIIQTIISKGPLAIDELLDTMSTKKQTANGRLNRDVVIVRTF